MGELIIKYNELTAKQFIGLWETVWGDGSSVEQTEQAMKTLYSAFLYGTMIKLLLWLE